MKGIVDEIYERNSGRQFEHNQQRSRGILSMSSALRKAKREGRKGVIAEFKRQSPSGFRNHANTSISRYLDTVILNGADALSILTEPDYFHGGSSDLQVAHRYGIPVLAKDFFSSETMIKNAYNLGADAVLLIADFLEESKMKILCNYAHTLGLEVLSEFHGLDRAQASMESGSDMIGYNRRDLRRLQMDGHEREALDAIAGYDGIKVLESGITLHVIDKVIIQGYDSVLIGEALLDNQNIIERLNEAGVR